MTLRTGTQDYDPIWRRQLREASESLLALREENMRKRAAQDLARPDYADTKPTEWPDITSPSIGT